MRHHEQEEERLRVMQSRQPCRLGDASQVAPGAQPALPRGAAVRAPGRSRWQSAKAPASKGPSAQSGASVARASLRVWPCAPALYPRMMLKPNQKRGVDAAPGTAAAPSRRAWRRRRPPPGLRPLWSQPSCSQACTSSLASPAYSPPACSPPSDIVLVRTTALPRQAANAPCGIFCTDQIVLPF